MFEGSARPLSESGLQKALDTTGVPLAALWAVMTVETKGCGFLADRRPQILLERHIFRKRTNARFDSTDPDLSDPTAGGYGAAGAQQYERLARAIDLDRKAALESTSWRLGQIMGFNAAHAGFPDVEAMVTAMCDSEDAQFGGMMSFIQTNNLSKYLQQSDWANFALHYNGPSYQKNNYDTKLAKAPARFSVGPLPSLMVRAAQLYLTFLGYNPSGVDGWFGHNTQKALIKFQRDKGLEQSGLLDVAVFSALQREAMG